MSNIRQICAAVVCLVTMSATVSAQDYGGSLKSGRLPLGGLPALPSAAAIEHFRDSMTLAMRIKDSLWLRPAVHTWRMRRQVPALPVAAGAMPSVVPAGAGVPLTHYPYSADYRDEGQLASWSGGAVFGVGSHVSMPGLMSVQNATVGVTHTVGRLTMTAAASAYRNNLLRTASAADSRAGGMGTLLNTTYFTVGGMMTYRFSDNISATVFGRYSTNRTFYSMAAMPYMATSGYGGYLTFMGETLGVDVGVERYYDTFARRWITSPIVTPKIKFSDKFTLALPVGPLVKDVLHDLLRKDKVREGPMIMPEGVQGIGNIPFGPPEMPR